MFPDDKNATVLRLLMPLELSGVFTADTDLEGTHLDAAQARAAQLLLEMFPGTCTLTSIADWERVLGLPDPCTGHLADFAQRREAVALKHAATGGLSRQYFIDLAARLGVVITIDEGVDGDPFKWRVNAPERPVRSFRAGIHTAGTRLRWWNDQILECTFNRLKPAHTQVVFAYGGAPESEAPDGSILDGDGNWVVDGDGNYPTN